MNEKINNLFDKALDILIGKNKLKLIILLFFIFGLIIRIIAANNLGISADDVNHAYVSVGIFDSGKLVNWGQSTALWYYLQGIFYNFFGLTMLGSRFANVLFGSFLIILMFIFAKKITKSDKIALIASFLVMISPVLIKNTLSEMDVAVCFFTLFSAYFLFGFFESRLKRDLFISALLIGIGTMVKLYALFFAVSFIIFFFYKEVKNKTSSKQIITNIFIFGIIISILVIPTIAHNYLLYKDKGFMDLIFTNTFKLGVEKATQYYSWGAGWLAYSDYKGFFLGNQRNFAPSPLPGAVLMSFELFFLDPILFILGLFGLIFIFNKNKDYFMFFIITLLPAFIYLGAQIPMSKHFIWILALFILPAAVFLNEISIRLKLKNIRLKHILILIIIINLGYLTFPEIIGSVHFGINSIYGKSSFGQLSDYKIKIPENALVVVDSRIYRGRIHWAFAETNYVESMEFIELLKQINSQMNLQNIEIYYIECVKDDCGWGTVANQPEFNQTNEQMTHWFANISYYQQNISGPDSTKFYLPFIGERTIDYRIYKTQMPLPPLILQVSKQTHVWWLIPEGYDRLISPIFDDYELKNFPDRLFSLAAWKILYFEIIISFLSLIYLIYLFIKD